MTDSSSNAGPTVVLVHGAFADAGSWAGVVARLTEADVPVRAIVNPLRGVAADAAYVASAVRQIPGPVVLVGHSYGGAVITSAAPQAENVAALVYVCAFAPDEGETVGGLLATSKVSLLTSSVVESQYPTGQGSETATEVTIDLAKVHEVFCADLPQLESDVIARSQRPIATGAFAEEMTHPGWKDVPVWAVVGTGDKAAGSDIVRSMAQRAGATITEIDGSHVTMTSQPDATTEVILTAVKAVSPSVTLPA